MALKLHVISEHHEGLGRHAVRRFGVSGGRIGRARDNDWVLPDPQRYISAHHCRIHFRAGDWVLQDTSTNGVFINEAVLPLQGEQVLQDGDVLRLGEYLLQVTIDERNDFSPDASGQLPLNAAPGRRPLAPGEDELGGSLDFSTLLSDDLDAPAPDIGADRKPAASPAKGAARAAKPVRDRSSALTAPGLNTAKPATRPANDAAPKPVTGKAHGPLTRPVTQRGASDTGLSLLADDPPQTDPADEGQQSTVAHNRTPDDWQAPARLASRRPGVAESGVEAFCRGAGLDAASLSAQARAELLSTAGQMLREVVLGMMDLLQTRNDHKDQLHLSQTAIRPSDNNPLKFSTSVDDALVKLLDGRPNSYLGPADTIRASFSDLRTHQTALAAATRVAMDEFMTRIAPEELSERFKRGLKRSAAPNPANPTKYWELYTEFYQVLNMRNEENLPTVFGDDLTRAYTEHAAQRKR